MKKLKKIWDSAACCAIRFFGGAAIGGGLFMKLLEVIGPVGRAIFGGVSLLLVGLFAAGLCAVVLGENKK